MKRLKILGLSIIALFLLFIVFSIPVKASMTDLSLISTNPGEDSSKSMRLSWQSKEASCTLYYTLASDTSFSNATIKKVNGIKNTSKYVGNDNYYKYDVELTNLDINTKYSYKIKSSTTTSSVYTFKTANNKGDFNFALIGDIHANSEDNAMKNANSLIKVAEELTKNYGGIDFVLSQGDLTKYGQRYDDWQQWNDSYILTNYMFASCPGNKEYYNTGHSVTSYEWFTNSFNNPDNGASELPTTYWFLYDSILFISVDNIYPSFNNDSITNAVKKWIASVIESNEGKYQYIILYKHYPDFESTNTTDYSCLSWGNYQKWYSFYDQYNIDYVISGDNHSYVRSHQLYDNKVSNDSSKGTVYITAPMCAPSVYNTVITTSSNCLLASITPNGSATHGAGLFKVTKGGLTYEEYGQDGKVYDTVTVKPKHLSEVTTQAMLDTIQIIQSNDKTRNQLYFNKEYNDVVTKLSIKINGSLYSTIFPSKDNINTKELNLKENDEVSVGVLFANNTNKNVVLKYNLLKDFGSIYGFNSEITNGKIKFSWKAELINNVVTKYKLFDKDTQIAELTSDKLSYESNDTSLISKEITFNAYSNETIVYTIKYSYFTLGDFNKDSNIDSNDTNLLANALFKGNKDLINHDVDEDNKFDIYDLTLINLAANKSKDLKTYFKVTYIDIDGNVIGTQKVEKGQNAKDIDIPNVPGYTFKSYSNSNKSIYQDTVIKLIYVLD